MQSCKAHLCMPTVTDRSQPMDAWCYRQTQQSRHPRQLQDAGGDGGLHGASGKGSRANILASCRMRVVMTALRQVAVLAKGRCDAESFSTMRSSSGTYS